MELYRLFFRNEMPKSMVLFAIEYFVVLMVMGLGLISILEGKNLITLLRVVLWH